MSVEVEEGGEARIHLTRLDLLVEVAQDQVGRDGLLSALEQVPRRLQEQDNVVALVRAARIRLLYDLTEARRGRVAVATAAQAVELRKLEHLAEHQSLETTRHRMQLGFPQRIRIRRL